MKAKITVITALALFAPVSPVANAQNIYAVPPAGFDPVKAAPAGLDRYGLPPRPDPQH